MASLRLVKCAVMAAALGVAGPVDAHTVGDVQRLYAEGQFLEAAAAGEAVGTARSLTLAARSLLAQSMFNSMTESDEPLLVAAQLRAEEALQRQPGSLDARLQLAAALGLRAQLLSNGQALAMGIAPRAQALISAAIDQAPQDPWAQALFGGWNLETVRRGGAFGAGLMGASLSSGQAAFERAVALAPRDPGILMSYATALLMLNPEDHAQRAGELFAQAAGCAPRDAFERLMRERAAQVQRTLRAQGPRAAAEALAAQIR